MCVEYNNANNLGLSDYKVGNAAKMCLIRSSMDPNTELDDLSPVVRVALMEVVKSTMEIVAVSNSFNIK